ncbi:MAG: hypothetical protein JRC55_07905 [Deltaproteobacteria bacterium]|nr:hypothetical protein [Deltaproteobacteria bacterium]
MENNKKEISIAEVRGCLLELIFGMCEADSRSLLAELQKRRQPKKGLEEKRKHPRRKTFIHVDCSFFPTTSEDPIKIIGKIVRIDSKGIGVQLHERLPAI